MKQKAMPTGRQGNTVVIVLVLTIAAAAIGFLVYQNMQLKKAAIVSSPIPQTSIVPTQTVLPTLAPVPTPKAGWKIYRNDQYGFEFSYPQTYQVLTDSNNLYGWPKAILLLYKGGQSYDMPVEVWNSEAEYKAKYNSSFDVTAYEVNGKFVTFLNQNKVAEVADIIATFRLTE